MIRSSDMPEYQRVQKDIAAMASVVFLEKVLSLHIYQNKILAVAGCRNRQPLSIARWNIMPPPFWLAG